MQFPDVKDPEISIDNLDTYRFIQSPELDQ